MLLGIWAHPHLEHRAVFSLKYQVVVSLLITGITTSFATIYSSVLTLTATHDIAVAWAGIGSAAMRLWQQKVVSSSLIGVVSVFLYLGNILVLHITIPALCALQTFSSSTQITVRTQNLPYYSFNITNDTLL
ncbi:hypothetical protein DFH09DRAFT_1302174 [Mycena vulgaris]|nr:hypothetical protein DFH09DRAFT_1302174 [Mycena vulgaris]